MSASNTEAASQTYNYLCVLATCLTPSPSPFISFKIK